MAENTVTIGLNLDVSRFNTGLDQAKSKLQSLKTSLGGMNLGAVATSSMRASSVASTQTTYLRDNTKAMKDQTTHMVRFTTGLSQFLRGGGSPAYFMNMARNLPKVSNGGGGPLAGIEGVGEQGATAATSEGGGIIGALGSMVASLGIIAVAALAISVGVTAFQFAFKPIGIMLNAIGKILGATLMPIALVIVELLRPLIWIMMPFIKVMNAIFAPLRTAIRNYYMNNANLAKTNLPQFSLGLTEAVGQGLAGSFIALLGELAKLIGDGIIDSVTLLLTSMLGALQIVFDGLRNLPIVGPAFGAVADALGTAKTAVKDAGEAVKTDFNLAIDAATKAINELLIPAIVAAAGAGGHQTAGGAPTGTVTTATGPNAPKVDVVGIGNKLLAPLSPLLNLLGFPTTVGDAIITPTGVTRTNPNDYIIATQDPSSLGGKGTTVNITFNVSGNMDDKTSRFIVEQVKQVVASEIRGIAR